MARTSYNILENMEPVERSPNTFKRAVILHLVMYGFYCTKDAPSMSEVYNGDCTSRKRKLWK